eukprot:scaffold55490_cov61-Cyclotella_meneghiniana.AAC.16
MAQWYLFGSGKALFSFVLMQGSSSFSRTSRSDVRRGMRRKGDRPYTKSGVGSMDMKCRRGSKDRLMIGGLQTIVSALYCGRRILSYVIQIPSYFVLTSVDIYLSGSKHSLVKSTNKMKLSSRSPKYR